MRIENEFAAVEVEVDTSANDPRLKVEDVSTGMTIYLDPLELQALAWARHEDLAPFVNPLFKEDILDRLEGEMEIEQMLRSGRNGG